ncbi:MAG: phosphate/phosphite/phosphonate ABC transporter substrate-binding protein [Sulfuricurvum sp.]|nr:phosphate/phosphite/phosphonate ABC transporter substrate-binding protein [Sulfuricurvum sp.]
MKIVSLLFLIALLNISLEAKVLIFGVVPQQSPVKLIKDWQPIISYLESATGEKIVLKIERSIPEFEKVLYSGGYDIAYMNPYHYVIAHQKSGYVASVRDSKNLTGILVVKKGGGISELSMLRGKHFLFPAPDAFAATLLTKYELLKHYAINVEGEKNFRYVNSHDSVYKGVARGIGDVGGGIERTFKNLDDAESKESLEILYKTKEYPSHPFAYKPSMPNELKVKMTKALLHVPQNLLNALNMKEMKEITDREYDAVRDIVHVLPSNQ